MKCLNLHFKKNKSEERSREKWSKNTNVQADLCWCVIYLLVASVLTKKGGGGLKCKFIKHAYKKYQLAVRIWAWGYYFILWRDNTNEAELRTPFQTDFNVKFQKTRSIKATLVNIIIVPLITILLQYFKSKIEDYPSCLVITYNWFRMIWLFLQLSAYMLNNYSILYETAQPQSGTKRQHNARMQTFSTCPIPAPCSHPTGLFLLAPRKPSTPWLSNSPVRAATFFSFHYLSEEPNTIKH